MQLDILTPEKSIFSGEVTSITLPGTQGQFQVLNNHAALISSLEKGKVKYQGNDGTQELQISSGFVEVMKNKVVVLVEGA